MLFRETFKRQAVNEPINEDLSISLRMDMFVNKKCDLRIRVVYHFLRFVPRLLPFLFVLDFLIRTTLTLPIINVSVITYVVCRPCLAVNVYRRLCGYIIVLHPRI